MTGVRSSLPQRPPLAQTLLPQRVFSRPEPTAVHVEGVVHLDGQEDNMDVEEAHSTKRESMDDVVIVGDEELDNMIEARKPSSRRERRNREVYLARGIA